MKNKYGIYQSSPTSCVFYKQDEDGNQSTFNIISLPNVEDNKRSIFAFIDNENLKQKNWFGAQQVDVKDIIKAFNEWASDAPFMFEMDAQEKMSHCLGSKMKKQDNE